MQTVEKDTFHILTHELYLQATQGRNQNVNWGEGVFIYSFYAR